MDRTMPTEAHMNIVVNYESLYGNTKAIADAIAAGLQDGGDVA